MQYCNHCQVDLRGGNKNCPLCGNPVTRSDKMIEEELFPKISKAYERHLAIRIMVFISLTIIIASFTIRMIYPSKINWPIFVLFGIASMWLSLIIVLRKRHNIPKTVLWQVISVSALSLFWDWQTGWRGWSLDYVIPIIFVAAVLVMYVTAKILKRSVRDYITYALLDAVLGIIPVLCLVFDWVNVIYPSVICVACSAVFLSAIFIFQGRNIKQELNKRMHI